jgi:hypothetical protein
MPDNRQSEKVWLHSSRKLPRHSLRRARTKPAAVNTIRTSMLQTMPTNTKHQLTACATRSGAVQVTGSSMSCQLRTVRPAWVIRYSSPLAVATAAATFIAPVCHQAVSSSTPAGASGSGQNGRPPGTYWLSWLPTSCTH